MGGHGRLVPVLVPVLVELDSNNSQSVDVCKAQEEKRGTMRKVGRSYALNARGGRLPRNNVRLMQGPSLKSGVK
jgi:hypothetical protein